MNLEFQPANPHGPTRYGYAWQRVVSAPASGRHLDIGCHDGKWLATLPGTANAGVDLNRDAVESGRAAYPHLDLRHVGDIRQLPFESGEFGSVSMLDVLEHMDLPTQVEVIRQVYRVLRPEGVFVVTVPGRHFFSFLDLGNLKFIFPRLHRYFYVWRHGEAAYDYRYVNNPFGLVGDVMATKRWHQHFSARELRELVAGAAGFQEIDTDGSGFFCRVLALAKRVLGQRICACRRLGRETLPFRQSLHDVS